MLEAGTFRSDLYYRINVVQLTSPRLADRTEDIPLLCEHFISSFQPAAEQEHFRPEL